MSVDKNSIEKEIFDLLSRIGEIDKETSPLLEERRKISKKVEKLNETVSKIELENLTKDSEAAYHLDAKDDTDARYTAAKHYFHNLGLFFGGGVWNDTHQRVVKISLVAGCTKSFKTHLDAITLLLPHVKENADGFKVFDIFEHSLSEFGSYYLKCKEKEYIIEKASGFRILPVENFPTLEGALSYISARLYYEKLESDSDY